MIVPAGLAGCGGDAVPTTPSPQPTPTTSLRVTIDSLDSEAAIASLTAVRIDATSDSGAEVRDVRIDFGGGTSVRSASARHVYSAAGTFMATATFTLRSGQQVTSARPVLVRAVEGLWHHAGYNAASRRFEIRRITLQQEGQILRGTLSTAGEPDRPIAGTLSGERNARFVADGQEFHGTVTSAVSGEGAAWSLKLQGGTASGQTLTFKPAFGEPSTPPVANLQLIQPEGFIVEGLEIGFDASRSSGQDLTYFVEYGDGRYTTEPVSRHALETDGHLSARLTVVDGFGRDAVATPRLDVEELANYARGSDWQICLGWSNEFRNPANGETEDRRLFIGEHQGRQLRGTYRHPEGRLSRFDGSLTGSHSIRFVLEGGGIEFTGVVGGNRNNVFFPVFHKLFQMSLTLRGGSADGQQLMFSEFTYTCS